MKQRTAGFTIVELVIVIAVIGILAAITIASYSTIQARAKDTAIKNGASELIEALQLWSAKTGKTPMQTGGGHDGNGAGWVSSGITSSSYPVAIEDVLREAGYLPKGFTAQLPPNDYYAESVGDARTYMLYRCADKYVVYSYLYAPTAEDTAQFNAAVEKCGPIGYGMEAAYVFE